MSFNCDLIQADSDERVRSWWNGETEIAHLCQVVGSVQENFDAGVALRSEHVLVLLDVERQTQTETRTCG